DAGVPCSDPADEIATKTDSVRSSLEPDDIALTRIGIPKRRWMQFTMPEAQDRPTTRAVGEVSEPARSAAPGLRGRGPGQGALWALEDNDFHRRIALRPDRRTIRLRLPLPRRDPGAW